ncbi:MAG: ABC transporter permease [Planctomycetota bacterium]
MTFAVRRILLTIPLLLVVSLVVFALSDALPGDAADLRFEKQPQAKEEWREKRGLNDPFVARWGRYIGGVATTLDFDDSYLDDRPVGPDLLEKLQATFELTLFALTIATFFGLLAGILSALYPRTPLDYAVNVGALFGISVPVFWLGMMLIVIAVNLLGFRYSSNRVDPVLDTSHFVTNLYLLESLVRGDWNVFGSAFRNILLPCLALATIPLAVITRMTRSAMLEERGKDYVRTAQAKGATTRRVVLRHALRNAFIPILTITGVQFGALMGGAVLTESVFNWPGLGRFIVDRGVGERDTPVLVGGILLVATVFILTNLAVDLLYGVIDPRVRRGRA